MKRLAAGLAGILMLTACAAGPEATPIPTQPDTPEPVQTAPPSPTPEPQGRLVRTDWSKLEPREKAGAVGKRWYAAYTDRLVPLDYGGDLIPYAGLRLLDDWPSTEGGGCLYGLMTLGGTVVVDPVYSRVIRLSWDRWWERDPAHVLPMLALCVGEQVTDGDGYWAEDRYAFAAADGAWATEAKYWNYAVSAEGVFASGEEGCELLSADGAVVRGWTWAELGFSKDDPAPFSASEISLTIEWLDGLVLLEENEEQARVLDTATGELTTLTREDWWRRRDGEGEHQWPEGKLDPYSGRTYAVQGDIFDGPMVLLDGDGTELARIERPGWYSSLKLVGGLVERLDRDTATYTDLDGNVVFRRMLSLGEE